MNKGQLKTLMFNACLNIADTKFSVQDQEVAVKNAIVEYLGLEGDFNYRDIMRNKDMAFDLINEVLDEVVPKAIEANIGAFAEVKTFARDAQVVFTIKTTHASRRRLQNVIGSAARGGIYRARRLDGKRLDVTTAVEGVSFIITLEEILLGYRTLSELTTEIANGWVEKIYLEVMNTLFAAASTAPAANRATVTRASFDKTLVTEVISVIETYGAPTIFGFKTDLTILSNELGGYVANEDLNDLRNAGYVARFYGTPVVELPNYLKDATNSDWVFDTGRILILPAGEKPVKVAFKGETYTNEVKQPHGGMEMHSHRMFGMALTYNNNIGEITVTKA